MEPLNQALRGAAQAPPRLPGRLESALVVGAGGTLGSALLAQALVAGRFQRVGALVTGALGSTVRGLQPLTLAELKAGAAPAHDIAFVVFERERHSNGRDDAFWQPEVDELLPLARRLHAAGVRRLLVLVPHAPALLPQALKAGFASLDEGAVAALGFEHLVLVRAAQSLRAGTQGPALQRFARWWLSQLSWMVPRSEQPVRAVRLAELSVLLARQLAGAAPGTRVVPPELLSQAAQADDPGLVLGVWLQQARP